MNNPCTSPPGHPPHIPNAKNRLVDTALKSEHGIHLFITSIESICDNAQSSPLLTGRRVFFSCVEKSVYISASPVTIDLYMEGIVIKIQSTVRILQ